MRRPLVSCAVLSGMMLAAGCSSSAGPAALEAISRYQLAACEGVSGVEWQLAAADGPAAQGSVARGSAAEVRTDAVDEKVTWLAMGEILARGTDPAGAAVDSGKLGYVPYDKRRGPAYPSDFWHSLGRDGKEFVPMLWDDAKATATNPVSLACLGAAAVTGLALSGPNGNDQVERHFTKHGGGLNDFWDTVGDAGGNPGTHFGVAGALYIASQIGGDTRNYEVSKTMLSALALNGLTTMALKVAVRTESPNGDEFGWPSGHASSSFCMATVLYDAYGPWVGVPAYAFATFVGYERIDARNHDFSDVVSGALIGIAIGYAVCQNHHMKVFGMDVVPYADPVRGGVGLALAKQW